LHVTVNCALVADDLECQEPIVLEDTENGKY